MQTTRERILDLWERELKLTAKLEAVVNIKTELTPLLRSSDNGPATVFRIKMQDREQRLLSDLRSVVAHRERLEAELEAEDE